MEIWKGPEEGKKEWNVTEVNMNRVKWHTNFIKKHFILVAKL